MISFPSQLSANTHMRTLPTATPRGVGELLQDMGRNFLNSATNRVLGGVLAFVQGKDSSGAPPDTSRIPYDVHRYPDLILRKPESGIGEGNTTVEQNSANGFWYENSLVANPSIYSIMNTYKYTYGASTNVPIDVRKYDGQGHVIQVGGAEWTGGTLSPSLFNPYYGIQRIGATKNTPLIDTNIQSGSGSFARDFTDCSIGTLCTLSASNGSELGQAKYKFADFMYCKDLGMPNNRMITLRRFATPVGDMIFGKAATAGDGVYSTPGDIGRLVGYFDTEDNKLEDILNYSFSASWEEKTAETQQLASKEDERGSLLGKVINTFSPQYRDAYANSLASGNNLLDWLVGGFGGWGGASQWYDPGSVLANYDKNKVYDPIDTVRTTHLYTGILQFNHEFTLTFNYTLRSYDNINPKSAMLDLLANATAVCYKRGHFWGGRQQILGAQPNIAGWQKANKIIDQSWEELGGLFTSLAQNGMNVKAMLGNMANYFQNEIKSITGNANAGDTFGQTDTTKKAVNQVRGAAAAVGAAASGMLKAKLKNYLGRPQMYLFNSILSGDNVGLWHVTIGNPRNPIAAMGNLIVTDAKIQQYGPLGQDDFPTGLKVIVTLKHARPRDMVDIQKMYTRGIMSIYQSMNMDKGNPWNGGAAGTMYAGDSNSARMKRNADELK